MRRYILAIGVFIIAGLGPRLASACSCAAPPGPLEALEQADAVFTGEVTGTSRQLRNSSVATRIRLIRSYKGGMQSSVTIYSADNSAACGFSFEKGKKYLVYAYEGEGELRTSICTRTTTLEMAEQDLAALGDGTEIRSSQGGCGGLDLVGALQAVIFVLIAVVLVRRP